jgi:hypothetical protein
MKNYQKALCVSVLVLTLTASVFAGDIQHPIAVLSPLPTVTGEMQTGATDGEMQTGKYASSAEADTARGIALSLLQNLLLLF